jgi:hypothetical protein
VIQGRDNYDWDGGIGDDYDYGKDIVVIIKE